MRICILLCLVAACGGSDTPAPASIHLTASGATPTTVTVPVGGQVRFINDDTASHQITSTCSEISGSPSLAQHQEYLATFPTAKSCNFSDPANASISGTVIVSTTAGGGGGGGGSGY